MNAIDGDAVHALQPAQCGAFAVNKSTVRAKVSNAPLFV
jgi:hypothetical protein